MQRLNHSLLFAVIFVIVVCHFPRCSLAEGRQPMPTGPVLAHPEWQDRWLKSQEQASTDEEAVKATVDAYYQLKYESARNDTLYDFGFLFFTEDEAGRDTYAYERGRLQYELACWRMWNTLLKSYEYAPIYEQVDVQGDLATVVVRPRAYVVSRASPERTDEFGKEPHRLVLVRRDNRWLIQREQYSDEQTPILPYGTDFDKLTRELPERVKKFLEEDKAKEGELRELAPERFERTPGNAPAEGSSRFFGRGLKLAIAVCGSAALVGAGVLLRRRRRIRSCHFAH
ncbi:MAG: hypothetical protein IMW97_02665 [Firmicutes bacterium]|nr:hypothetical protein [Candidatus Fermentithermobacillaceae bacterium]